MSEIEPRTVELITMPAIGKAALKEVGQSNGARMILPCQERGRECEQLNINDFCAGNKCTYSGGDKAMICHLRGGLVRVVELNR